MPLARQIPSARALVVFEAAARLLNFSRAASELNVTQPAVSHAVAALERHLQRKLFVRSGPNLALTEQGERLSRAASRAFGDIDTVLREIREPEQDRETVMLSLSSGIVAHWLMPRYDAFRRALPEIDLQFQLLPISVGGSLSNCDLGLRAAVGDDRHRIGGWFAPERVLALGAPGYLRDRGSLDDRLAHHVLINLRQNEYGWPEFLATAQLTDLGPFEQVSFPDYAVVLQAAVGGQGLVLGWTSVVSRLILDGALRPAANAVVETDRSYHLVSSSQRPPRPSVIAVRDWLIAEMEHEERMLQEMLRGAPRLRMSYSRSDHPSHI